MASQIPISSGIRASISWTYLRIKAIALVGRVLQRRIAFELQVVLGALEGVGGEPERRARALRRRRVDLGSLRTLRLRNLIVQAPNCRCRITTPTTTTAVASAVITTAVAARAITASTITIAAVTPTAVVSAAITTSALAPAAVPTAVPTAVASAAVASAAITAPSPPPSPQPSPPPQSPLPSPGR